MDLFVHENGVINLNAVVCVTLVGKRRVNVTLMQSENFESGGFPHNTMMGGYEGERLLKRLRAKNVESGDGAYWDLLLKNYG